MASLVLRAASLTAHTNLKDTLPTSTSQQNESNNESSTPSCTHFRLGNTPPVHLFTFDGLGDAPMSPQLARAGPFPADLTRYLHNVLGQGLVIGFISPPGTLLLWGKTTGSWPAINNYSTGLGSAIMGYYYLSRLSQNDRRMMLLGIERPATEKVLDDPFQKQFQLEFAVTGVGGLARGSSHVRSQRNNGIIKGLHLPGRISQVEHQQQRQKALANPSAREILPPFLKAATSAIGLRKSDIG